MQLDHRAVAVAVVGVWNGGPAERLRELLAPGYSGHALHVQDGDRDATTYASSIQRFREANPGAAFRIVELFGTGDRLVTRLEARRPSPTGGSDLSRGINISRFDAAGLLAEEWSIWSAWLDDPLTEQHRDSELKG